MMWQESLSKAQLLWSAAGEQWRDIKIEVGGLLYDYMIERLRVDADPYCEDTRRKRRCTRRLILHDAKAALKVRRTCLVGELMSVSQVVALLSDGGNVGTMTYSTLRLFVTLIQRPEGRVRLRREESGVNRLEPSKREIYFVRDPAEKWIALFRRAVAESWGHDEVRSAIPAAPIYRNRHIGTQRSGHDPRHEASAEERSNLDRLKSVAKAGTPTDVAALLYEVARVAPNPVEVAERLLQIAHKAERVTL